MRAPLAIAATMGVALALFLPTAASAQGSGEWIKFVFTPQAGSSSVCLTCGWHSACVEPYPWGPALDFVGSSICYGGNPSVYFRNFAFLPPGSPNTYVGYAAADEVYGELCKTVRARIWDTDGGNPLGTMWYTHTYLTYSAIIWLYANEDGYENEQVVARMADDGDFPENAECISQGYWTGQHLHERHYDGTSTFFLRNGGDCGATCDERYPCAPWPANCLYDPQDWWDNWVRAFCIDDTDCDGWTDAEETYIGTDPLDACPDNPSDDAWPLDINMDTIITVAGDVLNFRGRISATPGTAEWWQRLDLNADGWITVSGDVLLYRERIQEMCI